jgi:group I intron endonuclease
MGKRPQIRGLYKIESQQTKRIYIGISNSIDRRWKYHKYSLESGKHTNFLLQNHVNKYGFADLIFSIVELCEHLTFEELKIKEISTIKKFKSNGNLLFNLTDGGDGTLGQGVISCKIKNIYTGEVLTFPSITNASEYIGVDRSSMGKLLKGTKKQMKGWCAAALEYDQYELIRKNRVLYHKDHGEVNVGENMCDFARKYNLNERVIYRLFTKPDRYKSHKGWTTYNPKIEKRIHKKHRRIACYDKCKKMIKEFDFISEAAIEYNCNSSSIIQALKEPFVKTSMKLYWNYL